MFGLEFLEFAVFIYSGGEAVAFRFNRISRNMSGVVTFFLKVWYPFDPPWSEGWFE